MKALARYSEPYGPAGNLTAEGALNPLGRPDLDVPVVLVREAVQNCWDARALDQQVLFGLAGWELSAEQRNVLENIIFRDSPSTPAVRKALKEVPSVNLLAVYDRGTVGLGGPTRADIPTAESDVTDFVDFLRNIGQPPAKPLSGGTYGFGKAAFYRASSLNTILVHTRCWEDERIQSRFIAAALGMPYTEHSIKYTGRHWWGRCEDDIADPLLDQESEELAALVGLPLFGKGETGTTVAVLQPHWGDRTPLQFMHVMAEALLWYFWPKMLNSKDSNPSMTFEVSWNQEQVYIPHPAEFPPLQGYVEAMEQLKAGQISHPSSGQLFDIEAPSLKKHLGILSLFRYPVYERSDVFDTGDESCRPFPGRACHTALMRQAELVVRYLPGQPLSADVLEYAGVFIADKQVDSVFAEAEPPAHDDWLPAYLTEKAHKTVVRRAIDGIKAAMKEFAYPASNYGKQAALVPLGAFANALGTLLPGQDGPSASVRPFESQRGKPPSPSSQGSTPYAPINTPVNPAPASEAPHAQPTEPLMGETADMPLSDNIGGSTHEAPENTSSSFGDESGNGDRRTPPGKAKLVLLDEGQLVLYKETPALRIQFTLQHAPNSLGTDVAVRAAAVLDDNELEEDPPLGSETPEVLAWLGSDGMEYEGSEALFISAEHQQNWELFVSVPENIELGVNLTATARFES